MTTPVRSAERAAWLALVAVLSIALAWLALLSGLAWLCARLGAPPCVAAAATLARVLVGLARHAWPLLLLAPPAGLMLVLLALVPQLRAPRLARPGSP